jgi:hypothetical protein
MSFSETVTPLPVGDEAKIINVIINVIRILK